METEIKDHLLNMKKKAEQVNSLLRAIYKDCEVLNSCNTAEQQQRLRFLFEAAGVEHEVALVAAQIGYVQFKMNYFYAMPDMPRCGHTGATPALSMSPRGSGSHYCEQCHAPKSQ